MTTHVAILTAGVCCSTSRRPMVGFWRKDDAVWMPLIFKNPWTSNGERGVTGSAL
jgi:hypothetical protein